MYTFNILINCFYQTGKINCEFCVPGEIIKRGVKPDLITMSTLLEALCLDGKFFDAVELFDKLTESGFEGNVNVYGILINGLCKIREIDSAIHLHRRMICETNVVIY